MEKTSGAETTDMAEAKPTDAWVARFRDAWLRDGGGEWSDEIADAVLVALGSPAGKRVLWALITETASVPSLRFDAGYRERVAAEVADRGAELREQMQSVVDIVRRRLERVGDPDDGASRGDPAQKTIKQVAALLSSLGGGTGISVQVLELLDDVKVWSPEVLGAPLADGVIAAAAGFVISATANADRYRRGKIRWDDAIDTTTGDTVKAGLTGVIVSAVATALMPTTSPPVALAAAALLSPHVYALVGEVVDFAYLNLLGGDAIMEARGLHIEYLAYAAFARRELWPRIRQMRKAGLLVDHLDALSRLQHVDGATERTKIVADARMRLADFQSTSRRTELADAFTNGYEARVLKYYAGTKKGTEVPSDPKALVTYEEVAELERLVHEIWWRRFAEASGKLKVVAAAVMKEIEGTWPLDGFHVQRGMFLRAVIEHACDAEGQRGQAGFPLRFTTTWSNGVTTFRGGKTEDYAIHATFPTELVHIVLALEQAQSWSWAHTLGDARKFESASLETPKSPTDASTLLEPSRIDEGCRELNKFYTRDLYDGLRVGRYRMFEFGGRRSGAPPRYLAVPATAEPPEAQGNHVSALLRRFHPAFQGHAAALVTRLEPIDVSARSNADTNNEFMLACLGVRVLVLDVYTATLRVSGEELGGTTVVSTEGYFASLTEAGKAFKNVPSATLVGVRPGPKVISDALRKRARDWNQKGGQREHAFVLQNELLGRLGEGMILLDQLSNENELGVASLAGSGVFLSWWWSLTGSTRRALISGLKELRVQQTLRAEIMGALLEVQRIHVLSHAYFDEKTYAAAALAGEAREDAATKAITGPAA